MNIKEGFPVVRFICNRKIKHKPKISYNKIYIIYFYLKYLFYL